MLTDILKDKKFNVMFSFLMGIFITILIRPSCNGTSCVSYKAPSLQEIKKSAYKIGDTCYKFVPKDAKCPTMGVIEPFEWRACVKE